MKDEQFPAAAKGTQLEASDLQEPPTDVSALVLAYKDDLRRAEGLAAGGGAAAAPLEVGRHAAVSPPMHLESLRVEAY
ncbi:hypothetical protein E2C01_097519 [Portunus trituberculatus]|uniref:Uncharacterized protein n=1 Tax=Portunus trituberculatus TaxID=210409 RepID=A0A5B7K5W0_PORTR|nr:hypothetical protein [Portunus trituberculatus]